MATHMLTRAGLTPGITTDRATPPEVQVLEPMRLALPRVHEFTGPSRRLLALLAITATTGPVLWIRPAWMPDALNPEGVVRFADPARLLILTAKRAEDLLWSAEETLRAGACPVVVADLPGPPGLTPVRRLHLAAEAGATEGDFRPLGLLLTPGTGGAPGVESRWSLEPQHRGDRSVWDLHRLRARCDPPRSWRLRAKARKGATRVQIVSEPQPG